MADYSDLIEQAGRAHNVDPRLLSLVMGQESAGNPGAVSPKGASGLMQVMPATGAEMGATNLKDPAQNIMAGAKYLSQQLDKYQDPAIALAAYNAGPGAVDKHGGIPPFPETQNYVKSIMGKYQGGGSPAPSQGMPGLPPTVGAAPAADADPFSSLMAKAGGDPTAGKTAAPAQPDADPFATLMAKADEKPGIKYTDDSNNPNAIPGSGPRVERSGVAKPEPSIGNKLIGAGETALSLGTGALSAIPGGIAAGVNMLTNGKYGTQAGVNEAGDRFHEVSGAYTYEPRTDAGKNYLNAAAGAINDSGVMGLGPMVNMHGIGEAAKPATELASNVLASKLGVQPAAAVAERVEPTFGKPRVKLNVDGTQTPVSATPQTAGTVPARQPVAAPTIANATPELQAAVKVMESKGQRVNPDVLQRHVEADSLPVPVKLTAGQAVLDPAMISDEMNGRGKLKPTVSPDFYNAQGKALGANLDAIRAKVAPDVTDSHPTALGQSMVDSYKNMDAPKVEDIRAKYKALEDANGGVFPVAGEDIAAKAYQDLKKQNVTRFLPAEVKGLLDDIQEPGNMSMNDFQNHLTILGQQERKAARAGDGTAEHAIGVVRNAYESLPVPNENVQIKGLLDDARGAAKDRFDKIKADPAYKAAISDDVPAGQPSPLADKFIPGYVTGNNVRGANLKQMKANLAEDTAAHQTIAAATLDHLKGLAKADPETGKFMADGYNKGTQQLAMKLSDMVGPEAAAQLQQVGKVAKYTTAQPKGAYVNNSNSLVSALSAPAAAGLRSLLAVKTLGASEAAGAALSAMKQNKAGKNAVAPGAGINRLMNTPP